ncbi:unnamed protein product [Malus baccata var. baccata]
MQRSASTKQRSASFVSSTMQRSASSVSSTKQRSASFVSSTMQRSASSVSSTMQRSASFVSSTMQRSASSVSSWYLKVSRLAGSAKNYVASKAQGYVEWRLAEMKKRSALIVGLQFGNQSLDSTELVFEISIFNPFEFYLPVSQASFKFKSAGSEVLTGTLKESASLKPGEESIMFVLVKVPLRVFINLAKDISGDADINYEIDLSIKIKLPIIGNVVSLPIPCECQQGELKLSHLFSKLLDQINRQQLMKEHQLHQPHGSRNLEEEVVPIFSPKSFPRIRRIKCCGISPQLSSSKLQSCQAGGNFCGEYEHGGRNPGRDQHMTLREEIKVNNENWGRLKYDKSVLFFSHEGVTVGEATVSKGSIGMRTSKEVSALVERWRWRQSKRGDWLWGFEFEELYEGKRERENGGDGEEKKWWDGLQ